MDRITINEELFLSPTAIGDADDFVKYLNVPEIAERTLSIPYPYTMKDALWFVNDCERRMKEAGRVLNWQIRNSKGEFIGGIGLHGKYPLQKHRDEVGYWVAQPFWGKGIMTKVLTSFCEQIMPVYGLVRMEAPIFQFNIASQRVAQKSGFVFESTIPKAYCKKGIYLDGVMYALVK